MTKAEDNATLNFFPESMILREGRRLRDITQKAFKRGVMPMGRRAARVDDNQGEIVGYFRSLGCSVHITSAVGGGFTDLVVGACGHNALVEVKDPSKIPSQRKLTRAQVEFHRDWKGKVFLVETMGDALGVVEWMHKSHLEEL